jgi:hypothetical protein
MTDVETQSSQRTVIAFISGLLIGGLLVWVFSSTPEDTKKADTGAATDVEQVQDDSASTTVDAGSASDEGSLKTADQDAGTSVSLEGTTFPEGKGWVVIRDHQDGMSGGILGAARYDTAVGLTPATVELLRPTVSGNTYEAVFYTDDGATSFDLSEDMPVEGTSVTFMAN